MMRTLSRFRLGRVRPSLRRVLALDAGSRCIKLLLAESDFGRLRILKEELVDLQAEGLVSADEIKTQLQGRLEDWGNPALALVLPQHISISQVVDLPLSPESEVEKLIAEETVKLGGVTESRIIYDFVRTDSPVKNRQQFWVTVCQEGDIRERLERLGVEQEDLCEVTTTANALIAAYRMTNPAVSHAVLVHLGAQTTVVVVVVAGQGAFATSFQMGGDFFTRALARIEGCTEEAAETHKRGHDVLSGPEASPEFAGVVDGWASELRRQLGEWLEHNPAMAADVSSFEMVASGGGFEQPGLLDYLRSKASLNLKPWPRRTEADAVAPARGFEIAFGTALQALGYSAQPVSLLPDDYRAAWGKRLGRQRLELASAALVLVCAIVLALGTWHQMSLKARKQALLEKVKAAQEAVLANEEISGELTAEYESLRPIFFRQQNTLDTLKSLALLEQARSNRSFWYVLIADQQSYFTLTPAAGATNRPARTNLVAAILDRARTGLPEAAATNSLPARPGLMAELCIPENAESARQVLGQLVQELKQEALFAKADLLSDDLRRSLAEPKVLVPDRHFVLALDFAETQYQQPVAVRKPGKPRPGPKRDPRASRVTGERGGEAAP